MADSSRARLRAALGFLSLEPREPELQLLHRCFDTWRGIGDVVTGMARQEYDLELRRYNGQGWRAIFFQKRIRALADVSCRRCLGTEPVGGSATRGGGRAMQARSRGHSAARLDYDR